MIKATKEESAAGRVFAIPELLEEILLHLPFQNILVDAQRVDKTWQAVIKTSRKLQQALFFEPIPREMASTALQEPPDNDSFSMRKVGRVLEEYTGDASPPDVTRGGFVLNPLIRCIVDGTEQQGVHPSRFHITSRLQPNESWRHMYATQPPGSISTEQKVMTKLGDFDTVTKRIWLEALAKVKSDECKCVDHSEVMQDVLRDTLQRPHLVLLPGIKLDAGRRGMERLRCVVT